ncbi:MAG TPA: cytochrome c biogenesis protein CcsA [Vicinamibacterales bacterium]
MTTSRADRIAPVFMVAALVMLGGAPFVVAQAPAEASMGIVSKIFYFHVPAAMLTLSSSIVCGLASVLYLARRRPGADDVALAAAELVVVFGLIMLITGPLWARKAWGVWWVWEARLVMALVMWMIFVAYLLLRRFGGAGAELLAAAVGLFGMAVSPFVYWSVNLWRTMHPTTNVLPSLPGSMARPLWYCVTAFACLYIGLLLTRVRLARGQAALDQAFLALEDLT